MTRHSAEKKAKPTPAERKAKQRAKDEAAGIGEVRVMFGPLELEQLAENCAGRGGSDGPYTQSEYLKTLVRRDNELLKQQEGLIAGRMCEQCRKPLPQGCGGFWLHEMAGCERAKRDRAMAL